MIRTLYLSLVAALFLLTPAYAELYQLDSAHTQVHFTISHLMISKVRGNFNDFSGTVDIDVPNRTLKSAVATILVDSIDTRNLKRDKHLRSSDFFDVEKFAEMTFNSKKVTGSGADITVIGDLTIKGVTKEVTLKGSFLGTAKDPWGNQRAAFEATGSIDRRDFGLTWNKLLETGGLVVGDEVEIGIEVEAIKL